MAFALAYQQLSRFLREDILAFLSTSETYEARTRFIGLCHSLAEAFLASKRSVIGLGQTHGLTTSDLGYDCIAELFQKNETGCYIQLQAYFSGIGMGALRDEELLAHLRRLVFSKVNQGIFRLFTEIDPSLAKILRNIKLAVGSLKHFTEAERFGEQCIAPSLCATLEELPAFEKAELERELLAIAKGDERVPDLLAKLSIVLRGQSERCRIVPLVMVGLMFRSVYLEKADRPNVQPESADSMVMMRDVNEAIHTACSLVEDAAKRKYVVKGKADGDTITQYIAVIEEGLTGKFIGQDGADFSLYENLRSRIPTMSKEEYHEHHRSRLEYLYKLAQKKVVEEMKK